MFLVLVEKISARSDSPCLRNWGDSAGFEKILAERKKICYFHIKHNFSFRFCFTIELYLNT